MPRRIRVRLAIWAFDPVAGSQRASQDAAAKASRDSISAGCVQQLDVRGNRFAFAAASDRARMEHLLVRGLHGASFFDRHFMTELLSRSARKQSVPAIARSKLPMALPVAYPVCPQS